MDGHSVLVEDDKITGIVKGNTVPDGFKEINLEGKYLMPGLINMHVHLAGNGKPQKNRDNEKTVKLLMGTALSRAVTYKVVKDFAKAELMSGVTTIRTVGGLADFDTRVGMISEMARLTDQEYLQLMKEFLCLVDIWLVRLR
ncbi:MAG: amidohydrolase family protein [Lachnospira eligens]